MDTVHKYYLHHMYNKYMEFRRVGGEVDVWNVYTTDDKPINLMSQAGNTDLTHMEFMQLGRIIEIHNQVKAGQREYDSYALWSSLDKKTYLT